MKKITKTLILALVATATMGMGLPGCPTGDQVAAIQQNQDAMNRRLKNLEDFATKTQTDNLALGRAMLTLNDRYTAAAAAIKTANDNIIALKAQMDRKSSAPAKKPAPKKRR